MSGDNSAIKVAVIGFIATLVAAVITITPQLFEKMENKSDSQKENLAKRGAITDSVAETSPITRQIEHKLIIPEESTGLDTSMSTIEQSRTDTVYLFRDNLCEVFLNIINNSQDFFVKFPKTSRIPYGYKTFINTKEFYVIFYIDTTNMNKHYLLFRKSGDSQDMISEFNSYSNQLASCLKVMPSDMSGRDITKNFRYKNRVIKLSYHENNAPSLFDSKQLYGRVSVIIPDFDGDFDIRDFMDISLIKK